MKPKHIKKETANRLRMGFHTDLIDIFEEAIDLYIEDSFNREYDSFFADSAVHSKRIAVKISNAISAGEVSGSFGMLHSTFFYDSDDLAKVIEEYFNSLKTE